MHSSARLKVSCAILELADQQSLLVPACGNGPSPVSSDEILTILESIDQFSSLPTWENMLLWENPKYDCNLTTDAENKAFF